MLRPYNTMLFLRRRKMKRLWYLPALAIALFALQAESATAAYCGAISYQGCGGCASAAVSSGCGGGVVTHGAPMVSSGAIAPGIVSDGAIINNGAAIGAAPAVGGGTYTVMRSVQETDYDQVQETKYRTKNESYLETVQVPATRMVPETTSR